MINDYPYLPEGRKIKYVSIEDPFMKEAMNVRNSFSTDMGHPTGAVIVRDMKIIGMGANQSALKNKKLVEIHRKGFCIRKFLRIPSGQKYWLCPGCASFRHHGEVRAIRDAINKNNSIKNSDLYLYGHWWCCKPCWNSIIKAGIKDVYLVDNASELFKK
jgi:deoxycytidylate deaminase